MLSIIISYRFHKQSKKKLYYCLQWAWGEKNKLDAKDTASKSMTDSCMFFSVGSNIKYVQVTMLYANNWKKTIILLKHYKIVWK